MSRIFGSGGQSIGVSASASVLPMNIQEWFPLGWTGWISLCPRDSQESCPTPQFKSINSSGLSFGYSPTLTSTHDYWKNHSFNYVRKVMLLLFNMQSRLVITFLPRSKHLWISWLQSSSAVILEPKKIKSITVSPSICHEMMGPDAMILIFWMLSFKPAFSGLKLSSFIVHGILQTRILEWITFSFCRGSSQPRDWTQVSHIAGRFLLAEPQGKPHL